MEGYKIPDLRPSRLGWVYNEIVTAADYNKILITGFEDIEDKYAPGREKMGAKHACGYCHGITFDDVRGNCSACGGPRNYAEGGLVPDGFGFILGESELNGGSRFM